MVIFFNLNLFFIFYFYLVYYCNFNIILFFFRLHYFLGVERDNENVDRRAKATPIFRCNEASVKICNSSIRCISGALTNLLDDVDGSIIYGCELIVIFAKGFDVNLKYSSLKFNGQTCDKSDTFNQHYSNLNFLKISASVAHTK